jgi:hypothetical protein
VERLAAFPRFLGRRNPMKYALGLIAAGALILAAQIDRPASQVNSQPAAQLSEQDKAAVIMAAFEAKSHQKTPKDFTPTVGASVPKSIFLHGFKPDVAGKVPALKQYWYAYTDGEVALVDGLQTKVVAVIPIPAKSVSTGQGHHGAAEPADAKGKDGAGNAGSVPAYTSPETIK